MAISCEVLSGSSNAYDCAQHSCFRNCMHLRHVHSFARFSACGSKVSSKICRPIDGLDDGGWIGNLIDSPIDE